MALQQVFFEIDLASFLSVRDIVFAEQTCTCMRAGVQVHFELAETGCCYLRREIFRTLFKLWKSVRCDQRVYVLSRNNWEDTLDALGDELGHMVIDVDAVHRVVAAEQVAQREHSRVCILSFVSVHDSFADAATELHWVDDGLLARLHSTTADPTAPALTGSYQAQSYSDNLTSH